MKALRASLYTPDCEPAGTMVMLEDGIEMPLEDAVIDQESIPGIFVVCDVFDTELDDVEAVTLQALGRQEDNLVREQHMALSYYWNGKQLTMLHSRGTLCNPAVAPLTAEEIEAVLRQLAHHPFYEGQTVVCFSEDDKVVTMNRGKLKVASA